MYFPIFLAKKYDILALCDLDEKLFKNITPILIPHYHKDFKKNIKKLVDKNIYFIIVLNFKRLGYPTINDIENDLINDVLKDYTNYSLAYWTYNDTSKLEIQNFINQNGNLEKSIIHREEFSKAQYLSNQNFKYHIFIENYVNQDYIDLFVSNDRIYIQDGFKRQKKNADYPKISDFSDNHYTYKSRGGVGFGDFTIIGHDLKDGGGAAYAVAIHMTNARKKIANVHHFVSDSIAGRENPGGKFIEALNHMIRFIDNNAVFEGIGINTYRDLHKRKHFPGLPINKKLGIINHIEQIANIM